MKISPSKKNILKKIRQALSNTVPVPFNQNEGSNNIYKQAGQELEIEFAENFTKTQGRFCFCENAEELLNQLSALFTARKWNKIYCKEPFLINMLSAHPLNSSFTNDLKNCDVSVTGCEYLVARTGSIVLSSAQQNGRTTSVYSPVHICIAKTNQLVYDIKESLQLLQEKYKDFPSLVTFATGPSRTAD
ncbi:MAG: LUD domain-containing protein, partial [Bacteroidota bacterium]